MAVQESVRKISEPESGDETSVHGLRHGATAHQSQPTPTGSRSRRRSPRRIAVFGSAEAAGRLESDLAAAGVTRYAVVACINPVVSFSDDDRPQGQGHLAQLDSLVQRQRVDLLLLTSDAPRIEVFDWALAACVRHEVRVQEMSAFYEGVLRRVPVTELNAAWFQHVLHPRYVARASRGKRALDVVLALSLLLLLLPLLLVVALAIKLDRGPVLFRQTRLGERGQPFTIYKLRTMHVEPDEPARWTVPRDSRITTVGRVLRRFHLDELPQLYNVLRGDMSFVGPRPEQVEFVDRLVKVVPFYSPRHLVRPGLTGWAQIRCGYAGSEAGSVWKLCHDLYYLKHRSLRFDLAILARTVWVVLKEGESHEPQLESPPVPCPKLEVFESSVDALPQLKSRRFRRSGAALARASVKRPIPAEASDVGA